jgi:hypothetical protein
MLRWTILLAAAGFLGAAIFYSPYIGVNAQTPLTCPLCPTIISAYAPPPIKFIRYTFIGGTVNAAFLVVLGWVVWGIARSAKWVKRTTTSSRS